MKKTTWVVVDEKGKKLSYTKGKTEKHAIMKATDALNYYWKDLVYWGYRCVKCEVEVVESNA